MRNGLSQPPISACESCAKRLISHPEQGGNPTDAAARTISKTRTRNGFTPFWDEILLTANILWAVKKNGTL